MSDWSDRKLEEITQPVAEQEGPRGTVVYSYRPDRCSLCKLGYFRGGHVHEDGTRG